MNVLFEYTINKKWLKINTLPVSAAVLLAVMLSFDFFVLPSHALAELEPIEEEQLETISAQAGIDIRLEDLDINNITLIMSVETDGNAANGRDFHVIFESIEVDDLDVEVSIDIAKRTMLDRQGSPQERAVIEMGLKDISLGNPFTDSSSGRYGYVTSIGGGNGKVTSGLLVNDIYGANTHLGKSDPGCGTTLNCDGQMIDAINLYGQPTITGNVVIWGRSSGLEAEIAP